MRRAIVRALGRFKKPEAAKALTSLLRKEKSYLVVADAVRALGRTRQPGALETLKSALDQDSWADVVRAGALDGLAALRDDSALDTVMKRTRYGLPTRGRRAAVHAVATLGEGRKTRERLEELLDDKDPHFKIDVIAALTTLGDVKSRPALRRALEHELDGRVARRLREALRDLGDGQKDDRKRVNDELEGLRDELTELRNRLAKLEGVPPDPAVAKAAPANTHNSAARTKGTAASAKSSARSAGAVREKATAAKSAATTRGRAAKANSRTSVPRKGLR